MQPVYFNDWVNGTLCQAEETGQHILSIGSDVPTTATPLAEGNLVIRYGVEMLRSPHALVPGMFVSELGAVKTGRSAWDWLWNKLQLYPRAEVIGIRTDGKEEHLFVRDLDWGQTSRVLAYADENAKTPIAQVSQVAIGDGITLPDLLDRYLSAD
jgi:hypothetical protein